MRKCFQMRNLTGEIILKFKNLNYCKLNKFRPKDSTHEQKHKIYVENPSREKTHHSKVRLNCIISNNSYNKIYRTTTLQKYSAISNLEQFRQDNNALQTIFTLSSFSTTMPCIYRVFIQEEIVSKASTFNASII